MYLAAEKLSPDSRIWIYQANRELTTEEINQIGEATRNFLDSWTAHNQALNAGYEIRYNRFLILMVDEKSAGASGCSIDKSVHFIKSLEAKFNIDFFDRMKLAYKSNGKVEAVNKNEFERLFEKGILNSDSIVFNNLVDTKEQLLTSWEIPVKNSWHQSFMAS
jgi:hypothetical protein